MLGMEVCLYNYFLWGEYFQDPWVSFFTTNGFSVWVKNYFQEWCLMNPQPTFLFLTYF